MENKTLQAALVALPLTIGVPMGGAAFASTVTISRTATTTSQTAISTRFDPPQGGTQNTMSQLRRPASIQLSAGVYLYATDVDSTGNGNNNAIAVGTAHMDGTSAFGGITGGGSATEVPDVNEDGALAASEAPTGMNSNAQSAATTVFGKI